MRNIYLEHEHLVDLVRIAAWIRCFKLGDAHDIHDESSNQTDDIFHFSVCVNIFFLYSLFSFFYLFFFTFPSFSSSCPFCLSFSSFRSFLPLFAFFAYFCPFSPFYFASFCYYLAVFFPLFATSPTFSPLFHIFLPVASIFTLLLFASFLLYRSPCSMAKNSAIREESRLIWNTHELKRHICMHLNIAKSIQR